MAKHHVSTTVNGDPVEYLCESEQTLLDCLRDELDLIGAKEGCSSGDCGACSVLIDGRLVCACLVLGVEVEGKEVETIEGMAQGEELHVAAKALLAKNPDPTETQVRYWLAGNLCRCTGYDKIVRAVMDAAAEMRGA